MFRVVPPHFVRVPNILFTGGSQHAVNEGSFFRAWSHTAGERILGTEYEQSHGRPHLSTRQQHGFGSLIKTRGIRTRELERGESEPR